MIAKDKKMFETQKNDYLNLLLWMMHCCHIEIFLRFEFAAHNLWKEYEYDFMNENGNIFQCMNASFSMKKEWKINKHLK